MARRGFTLIELLVVLAVMGVLLVLVSPMISNALPGAELKGVARSLTAGLREARGAAIVGNRQTAFTMNLADRTYFRAGGPRRRLIPTGIDIRVRTAREEVASAAVASIRFFPDGSSTGGRITVSRGARTYEIGVDWLTGRIAISD